MKKSEARLLVIFGCLILAAITFFVLEVINDKKNKEIARQRAIKLKINEYQELISDKDKWEVRRDFVTQHQPLYRGETVEAPALEDYLRNAAVASNLEVRLSPRTPEPIGDRMIAISVEAKVEGPGADVLGFLTRLQAEYKFYAIPSITISADRKDPTTLKAEFIFSCWFVEDDDALLLEELEENPAAVAKKTEEEPAEAETN